jgi:acyl-CoA reductase-like NAD-dependent aldehyde dehydrogenase
MRGVERELAQTSRLSREDLASIIESLADLESAVMEEYLMMLQAEAMKMLLEDRPEANCLKKIIEWIAEDEKRHAQILEALKSR